MGWLLNQDFVFQTNEKYAVLHSIAEKFDQQIHDIFTMENLITSKEGNSGSLKNT